jgi:diadenylate cyclase
MGWIFRWMNMELMSALFGQFTNIGVILLIVVFQQEIRQFLLLLGSTAIKKRFSFLRKLAGADGMTDYNQSPEQVEQEVKAAIISMAKHKTGALIILAKEEHLTVLKSTGVRLDSRVSQLIIESIFEKNSPMHDGAMIIIGNRIYAASSILPLTYDPGLPLKYGLRHRAAIGVSEMVDVIAIVISEETGTISSVVNGKIQEINGEKQLDDIIKLYQF